MKIVLAKNIGFCIGVKRALEMAKNSLIKSQRPIQFLGEIIHNEKIIREIKEKGGKFISDPKKAKSGTLVIRAHGAPPLPSLKNIIIIDATCPLVKKAQEAAKTLFKEGYRVVIIGEKKHPEVKGIQGHIKNKGVVVGDESETKKIKENKKIGVIAQTTQNLEKVNKILEILKKKTKKLKWINTICPQVLFRQKELRQILKKADGVLVIGSHSSANTSHLAEIAKKSNKLAQWINSAKEIDKKRFQNYTTLGVVSGTSTPDWIIKEAVNRLKE